MNIETFKKMCKVHNQYDLKKVLKKVLERYYSKVINGDGFLYAPSENTDIMLVAHMDTVHKDKCKDIHGESVLWSPQGIGGDDRCGVFMICEILRTTDFRPAIVFCEDEEIGCVGAEKFANWLEKKKEAKDIKYLIELDRKNAIDAVYYSCGNRDFKDYIHNITGYTEATGSYSDICEISPVLNVASVNLSCGYYKEHTLDHYVVVSQMEHTFEVTKKLLADSDNVEAFNYNYFDPWACEISSYKTWDEEFLVASMKNGKMTISYHYAVTLEEAIGMFLIEHDDTTYSEIVFAGDPYDFDYDSYGCEIAFDY